MRADDKRVALGLVALVAVIFSLVSLRGGRVHEPTSDAPYANKLMIHILSAFAEYERELISQRTKDALQAAKARGVQLSLNGAVLAARNRAEAVSAAEPLRAVVAAAMAEGHRTLAEISLALNGAGLRTRLDAAWSPGTTHRLMKRLGYSL